MGCSDAIAWSVYNGADNVTALAIEAAEGGYMTSLGGVTRVTLLVGATTVDSDVHGSAVVWWTDTMAYRGMTVPVIKFALGSVGLTAGTYSDCVLTIYDATYTNGLRISNPIKLVVS